MKFSTSFVLAALPFVLAVQAAPSPFGGFGGNRGGFGGNRGGNNGGNNGAANNNNKGGAAAASTSVAASAAAATAAAASATDAAASSAAAASTDSAAAASTSAAAASGSDDGNIQDSTTLDPSVIATGFEQDGQASQEAGQVPSLTSSNNFINFCAGQTITNGLQIKTGSCNPAPMGQIAAQTNMPAAKFSNPKNGDTIPANTAFTITMNINNLVTGNFVNAATNYYSAPQQIDSSSGNIIGHSHFVVESLSALDQTTPLNNVNFAFFKGVNSAAVGGALSEDVTAGLPAGFYKLSSINSAANHQPALVAVAQHGSLDDAVYFTVSDNGAAASNSTGDAGAAASNSTAAAATATAADATASAAAATGAAGAGAAGAGAAGAGAAGAGAAGAGAAGKGANGAGAAKGGNNGAAGAKGANNGAAGAAAGKGGKFGGKGRRFLREYA